MDGLGLSLSKSPEADGVASGVSFRDRLRAWWHGYELAQPDIADLPFDDAPVRTDAGKPDGHEVSPVLEGPAGQDEIVWARDRIDLAEKVWGDGFVLPGGESHVHDLTASSRINAADTLLQVGVGMGGDAAAIIGKFGNYVTAYESDDNLAEEAIKFAEAHGYGDKLKIDVCPVDQIDPKQGYFRAAYMREAMSAVETRDDVLKSVCESLKSGESHFILTDLFHDDPSASAETKAWADRERTMVLPWNISSARSTLESLGVALRIVEDASDDYCAMVTTAWGKFLSQFGQQKTSPEFGAVVADEAAYWNRRVAAIQSGGLRYYKIMGTKYS